MKVIFAIIIIVILCTGCSIDRAEPLSEQTIQQIAMLPQNSQVLGYVNAQQMLKSPVYELIKSESGRDPFMNEMYREFTEKTGFDLREDIVDLLFAGSFAPDEETTGLFVAFGNYNVDKLTEYIKSQDEDNELQHSSYGTHHLIVGEEKNFTMCFADDKHFVAGAREMVTKWLDQFDGKTESGKPDVNLISRIERLPNRQSMWMLIETAPFLKELENPIKGLKNVTQAEMSIRMDESLYMYSQVTCTDDEKAQLVHDAVRGLLSSMKLAISDDRDAVDVINKIETNTEGNSVNGQMEMNQEDIKKMLQKEHTLRGVRSI
jgi:hypothetical protein